MPAALLERSPSTVRGITPILVDVSSDDEGGDEAYLGARVSKGDPPSVPEADLGPDGLPHELDDRFHSSDFYEADAGQVLVMRGDVPSPEEFRVLVERTWGAIVASRIEDVIWDGRVVFTGVWERCAVFLCPSPGGRCRAVALAKTLEARFGGTGAIPSEAGPVPPRLRSDVQPLESEPTAVMEEGYWQGLLRRHATFIRRAFGREAAILNQRREAARDTGVSFVKKGAKLFG